jgi:glycosyltransferase involved in cell wall biosynthesis
MVAEGRRRRIGGGRIDEAVEGVLLVALTPAGVKAALIAAESLETDHDQALAQWRLQIERARYGASAPSVATARSRPSSGSSRAAWSDTEREQLLSLGSDLRKVLSAPTTSDRDRKQLLPRSPATGERSPLAPARDPGREARRQALAGHNSRPDGSAPPRSRQSQFHGERAGPLWLADYTYLRCWEDVVFFSFVIDAYSRMIVGWQFAANMRTDLVLDALRMALITRHPGADGLRGGSSAALVPPAAIGGVDCGLSATAQGQALPWWHDGHAMRPRAASLSRSPRPTPAVTDSERIGVAVVVLCHNYGRFLRAAIDSALDQTYPATRVVVVDDGSTDDSAAVIASYGDRVSGIHKENGGQASAINAGFATIDDDLVIFLDADDTLRPDIVERVVSTWSSDRSIAKIQWRMELVDASGVRSGVVRPPMHVRLPVGDMSTAELSFPFDIVWAATSGNAFPVGALRSILPMPEPEYRLCADSYLQHLVPLLGPVAALDVVRSYRGVHGANAFERPARASLALGQIRTSILMATITEGHLDRLATRLGRPRPVARMGSVSDLANRLVSLRLDPDSHPTPGDTRPRLAIAGVRAARQRFDVRLPMRLAFAIWFVLTALAPVPAVRPLGESLLLPERRGHWNRLLPLLHRRPGTPAVGQADRAVLSELTKPETSR